MQIENKVVFINGTAIGVGFAIANQFVKIGETVIISNLGNFMLKNAESTFRNLNSK